MYKNGVREKSRECHNHKPRPFPDTQIKRKQTKPNKRKTNKRMKSTKTSSLFPITKTCLYIFEPLEPHFYIEKLGFTGVYIILLIFAQNIDCGYPLEPPHRGGFNEYPQSMFSSEIGKISVVFLSENVRFLEVKISIE